jgi:hypothetical protein
VLWVYKSVNGATNQFDKALIYDPVLDRFSSARFSGEFLFLMSQPGVTLEGRMNSSAFLRSSRAKSGRWLPIGSAPRCCEPI